MTERIRLTGRTIDWEVEDDYETIAIDPAEARKYEEDGWAVVEIAGKTNAIRSMPFEDGVIQLQPKIDAAGRFAAKGGHTNYGYSGYFRAYIYFKGRRKALVDFWTLFPGNEHHYDSQQQKPQAEAHIRMVIENRAGTEVVKSVRGYAFDPHAHAERLAKK